MQTNINIKKALLLINLLYSKEFVTLQQIKKQCGISRRTFFRYINILSEIDIPIYYDRNVRGYKLSSYSSKSYNEFNPNEIIYILFSLFMLPFQLKEYHQNQISSLISKITTSHKYSFDRVLSILKESKYDIENAEDLKELLISILIEFSINNNFPLKIKHMENHGIRETSMNYPALEFDKIWLLKDKREHTLVPIDKIEFIKVYLN